MFCFFNSIYSLKYWETFFITISNGYVNSKPLRHKEKIQKVNTEKSIKCKECPEPVSNSCTKKNQAMQDSDEGGLCHSPPASCRAYRKVFEQV